MRWSWSFLMCPRMSVESFSSWKRSPANSSTRPQQYSVAPFLGLSIFESVPPFPRWEGGTNNNRQPLLWGSLQRGKAGWGSPFSAACFEKGQDVYFCVTAFTIAFRRRVPGYAPSGAQRRCGRTSVCRLPRNRAVLPDTTRPYDLCRLFQGRPSGDRSLPVAATGRSPQRRYRPCRASLAPADGDCRADHWRRLRHESM